MEYPQKKRKKERNYEYRMTVFIFFILFFVDGKHGVRTASCGSFRLEPFYASFTQVVTCL